MRQREKWTEMRQGEIQTKMWWRERWTEMRQGEIQCMTLGVCVCGCICRNVPTSSPVVVARHLLSKLEFSFWVSFDGHRFFVCACFLSTSLLISNHGDPSISACLWYCDKMCNLYKTYISNTSSLLGLLSLHIQWCC